MLMAGGSCVQFSSLGQYAATMHCLDNAVPCEVYCTIVYAGY